MRKLSLSSEDPSNHILVKFLHRVRMVQHLDFLSAKSEEAIYCNKV